MNWQLVALGDVSASPWRNGGGVTRELAVWPPDGDSWTWRMAVAEVEHDGPFSRFPGIERWFAVLSGDGVQLVIDEQAQQLTCRSAPLRFDGGVATDCRLLGGATQDFNLMLRRSQARAVMRRLSGNLDVVLAAPKTIAVYAIDAAVRIDLGHRALRLAPGNLAWKALPAGTSLQVCGPSALWIEIEPCV
ncbi:MAG: hypothetical protein H6R17_146 [Proteobacteria bacterium]|nr:hypothetical protein [Pseudomonadota bacterium]